MRFTADQYFRASLERMEQAREIYNHKESFALAAYCGGLAVESMLRAFRWAEDRSFEGRHDLFELLKASRLLRIDDEFMRRKGASEEAISNSARELNTAMNEIARMWHNNLRYASEASFESHLRKIGKLRGRRTRRRRGKAEDPVKGAVLDLIKKSQTIVDRGNALWTSGTR